MSVTRIFANVPPGKHRHCRHNQFIFDERLGSVECALCGEQLNPMWVLGQLSKREARLYEQLDHLEKQADKAASKNRCKCQHCGKMTQIEKARP